MQILEGAIGAGKIMMPWGWGPPGWQREEEILPDGGAPKVAVLQLHLESSMKQEAAPKFLWEVGARGKGCLTKDGWMPCVGGGPEHTNCSRHPVEVSVAHRSPGSVPKPGSGQSLYQLCAGQRKRGCRRSRYLAMVSLFQLKKRRP